MGDIELQYTKVEKDFGVYIDEELKSHQHISFAVNKSSRMLWLTKKILSCLDEDTLQRLYKALVRRSDPSWNMDTLFDIHTIRWINWQWKRFSVTNIVSPTPQASVIWTAASCPEAPITLLFRSRRGDMIQVYKITNGIVRLDPRAFFNRELNERTRDHSQRLFVGHCRLEIRKNSFSQRVVQDWNSLSDHVVTAPTLNSFKQQN